MTDSQQQFGLLAQAIGYRLPLEVCKSAAGFYVGTRDTDGLPCSRESVEYWPQRKQAECALHGRTFTQKCQL
jgi:hypothetical protein